MDVNEELKFFGKFKNEFFLGGGCREGSGHGGSGWGGIRVDVNEELKFLVRFTKKSGGGGRVGGDQGGCLFVCLF